MGLSFRRIIGLGKGRRVNLSKSGASLSQKVGPLTLNSRGRVSLRLAKGLAYRGGCGLLLLAPLLAGATLAAALTL